jgi:hypothetical protein
MERIYTLGSTTIPALHEKANTPHVESYLANQDSQQLTPLMLEIITFQLQESALFVNFDNFDSSLN